MAAIEEIINFYSRVPLFRSLNKRQLEVLAKRTLERDYAAGTAILTQGKGGEGFFVVYKGKVEIQRMRSDGTSAVVNTLGPGDFFWRDGAPGRWPSYRHGCSSGADRLPGFTTLGFSCGPAG